MPVIDMIALDADDTLWDNEGHYTRGKERFKQLLARYGSVEEVGRQLDQIEVGNIEIYGYGIKSFALSMVETAIHLSQGKIPGEEIRQVIDIAREMLSASLELYDRVEQTLQELSHDYRLVLVTKGDRFEQERKILRSGLGKYFEAVDIVGDKTEASYKLLLATHGLEPRRFLMVGNSMRSDILPVLSLGGRAVYIPQESTWFHENAVEAPGDTWGYYVLEHFWQLPELLRKIEGE
jgi:putative hydrolase of the HAD superfamily